MASRVISAVLKFKDQNFGKGMRQANQNAGEFGRHMQQAQNKAEKFGQKAGDVFKSVGAAAGALAAGAVAGLGLAVGKSLLNMEDAFSRLQAQTGATGQDLGNLKDAAKEAFSRGYGESLDEVSEAVARVKQNMQAIDGSEIANVTSNALLMAKSFDSDVNEVTRGANNLMQAFGIESEKAFDLFTAGGQRGLNFSNEMFDNVAEYASLFGNMGYSAEEYFGIMERGAQKGVYNLDYVNDVMKEFQIRVKDGSKATTDSMDGLSKGTQKVWKNFLKGKGTVSDVASTVIGELKGMDDQVAANQIAVGLFGTKWEDLEADAMYAMLGTTDAMKDFEGATEAAAKAVEGSFTNRVKSAFRDLTISIASLADNKEGKKLLDSIATTAENLVPKIVSLAEKALEFANTIKNNWGPISTVLASATAGIVAFKVGMMAMSVISTVVGFLKAFRAAMAAGTVAQWAMNVAMAASPFTWVAAGLALLVAGGVALYMNWDTVRTKTGELWDKLGAFKGVATLVLGPLGQIIRTAVTMAENWVSTKSVWENVWNGIKLSASNSVNDVIGSINKLIETINKIPGVNIPIIPKVQWGNVKMPASDGKIYNATNSKKAQMAASYDVGSNQITHDQFANIHKDEMIIPARQAQKVRAAGGTIDNIDKLINKPAKTVPVTSSVTQNQTSSPVIHMIVNANQLTYDDVVNKLSKDIKLALSNM